MRRRRHDMRHVVARRRAAATLLATAAITAREPAHADILLRERDRAVMLDFPLDCLNVKGRTRVSLSDFLKDGKYVVLFFFPKDDSMHLEDANNEREATNFERTRSEFDELDAVVLGCSAQRLADQKKLVDAKLLTIPFVSDPSLRLARAYSAERATFITDPNGVIRFCKSGTSSMEWGTSTSTIMRTASRSSSTKYTMPTAGLSE